RQKSQHRAYLLRRPQSAGGPYKMNLLCRTKALACRAAQSHPLQSDNVELLRVIPPPHGSLGARSADVLPDALVPTRPSLYPSHRKPEQLHPHPRRQDPRWGEKEASPLGSPLEGLFLARRQETVAHSAVAAPYSQKPGL